jgi:hypothetical protein
MKMRDEADGLLRCMECGVFRRSVGIHVGVHGLTADEYRGKYGFNGRGLVSEASRARYRKSAMVRPADVRARFIDAGIEAWKLGIPAAYSKVDMVLETKEAISKAKLTERCVRGHSWTENAYYWPNGRHGRGPRKCKACERERYHAKHVASLAPKDREEESNDE